MKSNPGKKAALHSLGCKVNAYETEAMRQMLEEAGYEIVPFSEKADLYVINTCTVTNVADKKSRQMIHRAKKQNPDAIVAAAGCYVQIAPDRVAADDAADIIIGNDEKKNLIRILKEYEERSASVDPDSHPRAAKSRYVTDINRAGEPYEELGVSHPKEHTRAFVKVQDGCNQFCSYCIIPYARGRARSRSPEQVIREVTTLADNGFLEIVLTGIHISSYGIDTGDSLLDLIRKIHDIEKVKRIRLSSMEPGIITTDFVRELAGMEKVCPHFHLSLQSGSDEVLRRMNRRYTTREYLDKCELIRDAFDHPALTTDVIVGFPGETEEEFAATCEFVKKVSFYEIHVFRYSRQDGTAAARMDGQIPEQTKAERSRRLIAIAGDMKREFENWYEGKEVEVLFEEPVLAGGEQFYTGFTPEYIKVRYRTDETLRNRIMKVEFCR